MNSRNFLKLLLMFILRTLREGASADSMPCWGDSQPVQHIRCTDGGRIFFPTWVNLGPIVSHAETRETPDVRYYCHHCT
jgi:hypothetical protein